MNFLNEGTFVGVGAVKDAIIDPEFKALKADAKTAALKTLKLGGSVTTEDEEADIGYGKDPRTGKFKSMSSNDAIKHFLAQVKQGVEDEGDEWPTLKEDLDKFIRKAGKSIRKAGGAEYKTPFTDLVDDIEDFVEKDKDKDLDGDGDVDGDDDLDKFTKSLTDMHTWPQKKFDNFIKKLGRKGYDKSEIKKYQQKRKDYQAKIASDAAKKKEKKDPIKEIVKKCLNRGMIKENISKVVKKYLAEVKLLNESWMSSSDGSKYKLATEKKALGNLFHPNSDNTAYVYNREHLSNLIKAIGYPDYEEVTSEFINIFAPADEDELRILRNQEGNPELQPNDLTIGMYIRHIKNEFSNKNYPSIHKQSI